MKYFLLLVLVLLATLAQTASPQPASPEWAEVDRAIRAQLPRTAIEHLDAIIARALEEEAYAETVRAVATRVAIEGQIEGRRAEERITRLEARMRELPDGVQPVLHAILGHWYWDYFQQNRWRFMDRTRTAEPPGEDFTTWDLPRILAEIDAHFTAALDNREALRSIPVSDFDGLLNKGTVPDTYRPTLFDFLAHEAISFYAAGEQAAVQVEDPFILQAGSPIFSPIDAFLEWDPESPHADSVTYKAIRLYQDLLAFHNSEENQVARIDVDLARLRFGYNTAVGPEKNERYMAALSRFVDEHRDHEISARALFHWAGVLMEEEDYLEAHRLAGRGVEAFPASIGGVWCANLIERIEAKSVQIQTERVWNNPAPDIRVTYRNIDEVHFRAVPYDYLGTARWHWNPASFAREIRSELLAAEPAHAWSADLPATDDYRERVETLTASDGLEPGFYFILASPDRRFTDRDNQVSVVPVWVSDLAMIIRTSHRERGLGGLVIAADSGEPIAGATVHSWIRDEEGRARKHESTETDEMGLFRFDGAPRRSVLMAEHNGHRVATVRDYSGHGGAGREQASEQTVFFTDRALYRPGQTIHYKGVGLRVDRERGDYRVLEGRSVTVALRDRNGDEVARRTHRTNDYGSISGSFTAPDGRLTGAMTIQVVAGPAGSTSVRVEEYQRPRFRVELEAPDESARLDEEVTLTGKATSYTGAAVGNGTVRWRVVREVRFPPWCWWGPWRWGPGGQESQAIAHGTAVTERDGSFTVTFTARPDPTVPEADEPTFVYRVHADITDTAGETRSASRTVRAGYTALQAELTAAEWQVPDEPVALTIKTTSLDGDPEPAEGTVTVHSLRQPDRPVRGALEPVFPWWRFSGAGAAVTEPEFDPANPDTWELDEEIAELSFRTDPTGETVLDVDLPAGIYRATLATTDRFGKSVSARRTIKVIDPAADEFPIRVTSCFSAPKWSLEPGESFIALWGTGYETGRAFVEIEQGVETLLQYWTETGTTQAGIECDVTEEMRGGFTVRITHVRENRAYIHEKTVDVPWTNKQLSVRWERFRSNLEPGQHETWTAVIEGPDAEKAAAEMVAALYDASLDQYLPHDWARLSHLFRREYSSVRSHFQNNAERFNAIYGSWQRRHRSARLAYRHFPREIVGRAAIMDYQGYGDSYVVRRPPEGRDAAPMRAMAEMEAADSLLLLEAAESESPPDGPRTPDLDTVSLRENLNETAFFFPHLTTDENGAVRMEFTMPEALTEWRFLGFAHDPELRSGFLEDKTVTSKELMVEPLAPRFVREGDVIEFPVMVSNQSAARQTGRVRLSLLDARTLDPRDAELENIDNELEFDIPAKESRTFFWRIRVPDGSGFLVYRAAAATRRLSDGEEGYLPVLSRRILVTESLPLPIRGQQTKTFSFDKLLASGDSDTLMSEILTVQMTSQPAWYAVMALPYLMEFPHECSEQVFNRLYANALARHIANSDPRIRRIFNLWRNTPALDSPLEKNEDLKSVMLEETPWLRQARSESEARRQVGILFDDNRLDDEISRALSRLAEAQRADGFWPWFSDGRPNEFITLYITTGFARLRHLGADIDLSLAERAVGALDGRMKERYERIRENGDTGRNNLTPYIAFYLYGRSFFLQSHPIDRSHREAIDFWRAQAREYWIRLGRQSQGHVALGLHRFGDRETPVAIMNSIHENAVFDEEMGMLWRDLERNWWWYRAPIETQALMIEAFDEIMGDAEAVEEAKVWLLKQKQTRDWKTTKATADAVYAILLRGADVLGSDAVVEVALAGETVDPGDIEPGTGFYEARFVRGEIRPEMGDITVTKTDEGVSWGSVHWQYLEDIGKITPHEETPLQLRKRLFVKETTARGQELSPVEGPLSVGDELVVRVELRVDREMEYVHLKDQRGSGSEPVNVLSGHRYQDGLRYYESTRDTASHFFIEYLPRGVYVFEYSTHIRHRGTYQSGIATIQCMYAPEFNSHSESFEIRVN